MVARLLQVSGEDIAGGGYISGVLEATQSWSEQGKNDDDNPNDDQQLDQRKSARALTRWKERKSAMALTHLGKREGVGAQRRAGRECDHNSGRGMPVLY